MKPRSEKETKKIVKLLVEEMERRIAPAPLPGSSAWLNAAENASFKRIPYDTTAPKYTG